MLSPMQIGTPVTLPDGQEGVIVGRDGHPYEQYQDGGNPNVRVYHVRVESGEIRLFTEEALSVFGSEEEIRRSGALK